MMTAATSSNIATTTMSATLCSEERTTHNSNACAAEESDSDRDAASSQTRASNKREIRSKGNFASQTVRLLREERGVQVETEEEGVANDERKEGERSELARLRVSLIEAKVG